MNFKKVVLKNKNNKLAYYLRVVLRELVPSRVMRRRLPRLLQLNGDEAYILDRVNYYNKLENNSPLGADAIQIADYKIPDNIRVYYFDSKEHLRYFSPQLRFYIIPGDVVHIPEVPSLIKSRPIAGNNANSVLLKLNKIRHFNFLKDDIPFENKRNMLVGRSGFNQPHRALFYEMHHRNQLCDLKKATRPSDPDYLSITQHLQYKFILALEGNDVATNLKWIMSSNSIAVMPMPKFETWFMEGRLIPDYHFICIKDDYSDLNEKLTYYAQNTAEALKIVRNAHQYIDQFKDQKRENSIALQVLQKYFKMTGQV